MTSKTSITPIQSISTNVFRFVLFVTLIQQACAQEEPPEASFPITFLLLLFFLLNYVTPIMRWFYSNYLEELVEKATKEMEKASKRMSDRVSDASRKASQSIRTSTNNA